MIWQPGRRPRLSRVVRRRLQPALDVAAHRLASEVALPCIGAHLAQ